MRRGPGGYLGLGLGSGSGHRARARARVRARAGVGLAADHGSRLRVRHWIGRAPERRRRQPPPLSTLSLRLPSAAGRFRVRVIGQGQAYWTMLSGRAASARTLTTYYLLLTTYYLLLTTHRAASARTHGRRNAARAECDARARALSARRGGRARRTARPPPGVLGLGVVC